MLTAAMFSATLNLAGCYQDYQNVYGPPPDEDVMTPPTTTTLESEIPTENDEYDPAKDDVQNVYGPPISFTINY